MIQEMSGKTERSTRIEDSRYSTTPLIRINWDGEQLRYVENPHNWIFILKKKKGYIGSMKFGCYCTVSHSLPNPAFL